MTSDGDYHIGRRGAACAACATALAPGDAVASALYRAATGGESAFERRDFCAACFDEPGRRGEPFSWWSAVVPAPQEKKAVFDTGVAREFLRRLLKEDAPERASLRYLLALLLMRKKVVKVNEQFLRDGVEVMVVVLPPDEAVFEIACLEIDEAESEKLREELGRLFAL